MKHDVIEEMIKLVATGEVGKSKAMLINSLIWDESEETIKALEDLAEENYIFVEDNGYILEKKHDETQGEYIDRINTEIKLNFSKEKYLVLKEEFKKHHFSESDNNISKITYITSPYVDEKRYKIIDVLNKKILIGTAMATGIFILGTLIKKSKKR